MGQTQVITISRIEVVHCRECSGDTLNIEIPTKINS